MPNKRNKPSFQSVLANLLLLIGASGMLLFVLWANGILRQPKAAKPEVDPALAVLSTEDVQPTKANVAQTEAPQTDLPQTEASQTDPPQTEALQTEPPQTEAPQTETPETAYDPTEGGIHRYAFYRGDSSWKEARERALQEGGYLARINSEEEYQEIVRQLSKMDLQGVIILQIGGRRGKDKKEYRWVNEDNEMYGEAINKEGTWSDAHWMENEPSYEDSYGDKTTAETKLSLYLYEGTWYFNDGATDIVDWYPPFAGKVGYIVEFED